MQSGVSRRDMNIQALTALDRCDRCGARAVLAFNVKGSETPLMMCGHHAFKNKDGIRKAAEHVWDARGELIVDRIPVNH
jgi:hypothetical protein